MMTTVGHPNYPPYTSILTTSWLLREFARAYGSKDRLAARRQPTDQYDGALDTIDDHIGAAQ